MKLLFKPKSSGSHKKSQKWKMKIKKKNKRGGLATLGDGQPPPN